MCVLCRANDVFNLFGTILFGLFCFYLQLAVIKGNFKFGLNLLIFKVASPGIIGVPARLSCRCCVEHPVGQLVCNDGAGAYAQVHPMRVGATIMSSFLFNIALILLATTAAVQFCAVAFAQYADGTQILSIFGNEVRHAGSTHVPAGSQPHGSWAICASLLG
jgi:LMBR1 domain-containing protein 1